MKGVFCLKCSGPVVANNEEDMDTETSEETVAETGEETVAETCEETVAITGEETVVETGEETLVEMGEETVAETEDCDGDQSVKAVWDQEKYQQFLINILRIQIPSTISLNPDEVIDVEGNSRNPATNSKKKGRHLVIVNQMNNSESESILPDMVPSPTIPNEQGPYLIETDENDKTINKNCVTVKEETPQEPLDPGEADNSNSNTPALPSPAISDEFPFCGNCKKEIESLYILHQEMTQITKQFEETRDKLAASMVDTFFQQCESMELEAVYKGKLKSSAEVYEKWKHCYTGKTDEESRIKYLLEEKDYQVVERERKLRTMKLEIGDAGFGSLRPYGLSAMQLAKIQRAMTVCYFTPKMSVIRKRNRLYFKVGVKPRKLDVKHICKICTKEFPGLDTLNVHLRGHFLGIRKRYKCSFCLKVYNDRKQLLQHTKSHADSHVNIKCDSCEVVFLTEAAQRAHTKKVHRGLAYQCDVCLEKFPSPYFLKKHVGTHTEIDFSVNDLFSCKVCTKTFLKLNDLTDHVRIHSEESVVGCEYCGKAFANDSLLAQHLEIHQGDNPENPYICEECNTRFPSEVLMITHLKHHRPKVHICDFCGKACRSKDGLRKHELSHTGNKPFNCDACDTGFIERKTYEAHMIKHTGKLPYKCDTCVDDEGFKDSKDLRKHRIEAHPELLLQKNIVCEFCWNTYPTHEALQEHITKIHERYKCHVCNRIFKLGDHLRRHMYIHTGEKPYKCGRCSKSFNQESNLKEHMYRHTGIRPHKCPHCDTKGYLRRIHLKEHMLKEHGTDVVPQLPMGRASQNARKAGQHPVPDPSSSTDASIRLHNLVKTRSDIPIIVSTTGTPARPVLFRNSPRFPAAGSPLAGFPQIKPIIMRNILPKPASQVEETLTISNSSNVSMQDEEIQTIHVKSENPHAIIEDDETGQRDQQFIIFL